LFSAVALVPLLLVVNEPPCPYTTDGVVLLPE
jgi:hypothetical protein